MQPDHAHATSPTTWARGAPCRSCGGMVVPLKSEVNHVDTQINLIEGTWWSVSRRSPAAPPCSTPGGERKAFGRNLHPVATTNNTEPGAPALRVRGRDRGLFRGRLAAGAGGARGNTATLVFSRAGQYIHTCIRRGAQQDAHIVPRRWPIHGLAGMAVDRPLQTGSHRPAPRCDKQHQQGPQTYTQDIGIFFPPGVRHRHHRGQCCGVATFSPRRLRNTRRARWPFSSGISACCSSRYYRSCTARSSPRPRQWQDHRRPGHETNIASKLSARWRDRGHRPATA